MEKYVLSGEISPRQLTTLSFQVNGKISRRYVDNGEHVKKGQIIASLDQSDFGLAIQINQQKVNNARFEANQAESDEKRFKNLAKEGALSRLDYDRQKTLADKIKSQLLLATKELELARNNFNYTDLVAPFDGIVSNINFEVGDVIQKGRPIASIFNNNSMEIVADLPDQLVNTARSYQARLSLWDFHSIKIALNCREINPIATEQTKAYQAKFSFVNEPPALKDKLFPGMMGKVILTRNSSTLYSKIPAAALVQLQGKTGVWEYKKKDNTVQFVPVTVIRYTLNEVIVSALPNPIQIISSGAQKISSSSQITVTMQPLNGSSHE